MINEGVVPPVRVTLGETARLAAGRWARGGFAPKEWVVRSAVCLIFAGPRIHAFLGAGGDDVPDRATIKPGARPGGKIE